ncbi:hypothetical protein JW898_00250 [Candidatus Woesearchaeota archaeon]|nr:hypothetical protein [Candidatus Woesearchaeota archaeon]
MAGQDRPAGGDCTPDASLEGIVGKHTSGERHTSGSRVYFLSEVGYDTAYFNAEAYERLVEVMSSDKGLTGILIDGAVTRLDRPEYLNDRLTFWDKSEEECKKAGEAVPNKEQYKMMMDVQLGIVEERLKELKSRVPHAGKVVLSLHSDDIQYTVSAMLNEMLIRCQAAIGDSITHLKSKKKSIQSDLKTMQKEYACIGDLPEQAQQRSTLKGKIDLRAKKVDGIENKLQDLYQEQKLYREKRVRPAHQFFTQRFMNEIYGKYREMCDRLGVELVTSQSVVDFRGMVVDYAHSRNPTWNPVRTRDKALVKSVHGKLAKYEGIDVILESGHFGIGYKQLQKVRDHPDETNFKNQSSYDPETCDRHITVVMALPFEDQRLIGEYVKGRKAVRMSGGKPMNTRKIAATDRYNNDGVAGVTVLTKDENGIVGTEWIQYQNFADGSVLRQPEEYTIICASSDEHIGSPEESPIVRDGWVELYRLLVKNRTYFRGRQAAARGYINAGDVAEANSRKWDHRYHEKRDPHELMRENLRLLANFRPDSLDDVVALATKMTNDAMGGSVESMKVILERVADYFQRFLLPSLGSRGLKWAHVCTTGNHADAVLRDLGMRETDFFVQRLKALGVGVYEVGKPDYFKDDPQRGARVFVGGYSNSRGLNIPDYGLDIAGNVMFGPINLVVQHDPKGSGMSGVIGAGKNAGADVTLAGHTHDNRMKLYRTDDNRFGVAYKLATLQGVSPTEKYYSYSVPRTQAAQCLVMPMPGDFSEKAIPAHYLRDIGRSVLRDDASSCLEEKRKRGA